MNKVHAIFEAISSQDANLHSQKHINNLDGVSSFTGEIFILPNKQTQA